jgi:hypothetical protein
MHLGVLKANAIADGDGKVLTIFTDRYKNDIKKSTSERWKSSKDALLKAFELLQMTFTLEPVFVHLYGFYFLRLWCFDFKLGLGSIQITVGVALLTQ